MTEYAVELRNIVKVFPGGRGASPVIAVDDLDLQIEQGEFFTLLGPSGCGKTTTLRMIAGFELPTSGELLINNSHMANVAPNRRPVNTVFQNYALFPHLTVLNNVAFGLNVARVSKRERQERARSALALVQLEGMDDRRPNQLSGGQQQRVALARALVNEPEVLLLDEPLGALDLKLRKAMQLELKHIQQQVGITFIYVTHDQEEALTMSDRVAVMNGGKLLQVADPVTLYEKPTSRFVADFIGETNFISGSLQSVEDRVASVLIEGRVVSAKSEPDAAMLDKVITVAVRPEKVRISATDEGTPHDGEAGIIGSLQEVVYIGTDTRYIVALSTGESVAARVQNASAANRDCFSVGDRVELSWHSEDAWLLPTVPASADD